MSNDIFELCKCAIGDTLDSDFDGLLTEYRGPDYDGSPVHLAVAASPAEDYGLFWLTFLERCNECGGWKREGSYFLPKTGIKDIISGLTELYDKIDNFDIDDYFENLENPLRWAGGEVCIPEWWRGKKSMEPGR